MKPFANLTKKHAFVKVEPKSRRSPIEDVVRHVHEEQDREAAKNLVHDSYANAVKYGESDENNAEQQDQKDKFFEEIYSEIDKKADESVPAITEKRNNSLESKIEKKKEHELPTMEYERESIVQDEYKWAQEHGMIPLQEEKKDLCDLNDILKYIDQNRNILELDLNEMDKKRLNMVMEATNDFKTIKEENIQYFREDLIDFYQKTKKKFANALSEITMNEKSQ